MKTIMQSVLVAFCFNLLALAQDTPQAYVGARIIPINGPEFPEGVLVVHQGKIVAVGPARSTSVPSGAQRHDVKGRVIMPGLVDTHSHIGGVEGADSTAPIQPDVRVLDSINVRSPGFQKAQAGGITTANIMPGSGHLLSGQTLYLKLRDGSTIDDLLIRDGQGNIAGGLKMANGTNSRREPPFPGTRAKSAALVREQYVKAQEYQEKIRRANGDREKMPERDLRMESLVEVLEGKRTVHHHTHRHDDVLTAIRLAKEFGFRMVLQHVSEAWKIAPEIAASGFPVSLIVLDSPGGKLEAMDVSNRNGAVLEKAGVLTGFHTDDSVTDSRHFLRSAAFAVRDGMSREKGLEALTIAGAKMLELKDRVGSLEPGKDGDVVLYDGDPFEYTSHVVGVVIQGEVVSQEPR